MYAITGITGRVGGIAAKYLLAAGQSIRAIVRSSAKGEEWAAQGAEVAVAVSNDVDALTEAFTGVDGVFVMIPPYFTPEPGFPEARAIIDTLRTALEQAKPGKIVALSSVGAQHDHSLGLITQSHMLEVALSSLSISVAMVRPAWFMENSIWDIPAVKENGELPAFLSPLDSPIPMVATEDIGQVIAETLQQTWTGKRIIEMEGPRPYSQNDIAAVFSSLLSRPVSAVSMPHDQWSAIFQGQGATSEQVKPRIEMIDGFNSGWITFEGNGSEHIKGQVTLDEVLAPAI